MDEPIFEELHANQFFVIESEFEQQIDKSTFMPELHYAPVQCNMELFQCNALNASEIESEGQPLICNIPYIVELEEFPEFYEKIKSNQLSTDYILELNKLDIEIFKIFNSRLN